MTRFGSLTDERDPVVVMRINVLPRGSGNRAFARRLAKEFRTDSEISPHVLKAVAGASSVVVHFRPSVEFAVMLAAKSLNRWTQKAEAAALADQPMLPGLAAG